MQFKKLDGGQYALYEYYDSPEKLNSAYKYMFEHWLPISNYDVDHARYNLEFNMNNPVEDPEGKLKLDLFVPIKNEKLNWIRGNLIGKCELSSIKEKHLHHITKKYFKEAVMI